MSLQSPQFGARRSSYPSAEAPIPKYQKRYSENISNKNRLDQLSEERKQLKSYKTKLLNDFIELKNTQGHQYSVDQNQIIVTEICGLIVNEGMEENKSIQLIARITGSDYRTIQTIFNHWKSTHEILESDTSNMGKGNPSHPLHIGPFSIEIECRIHNLIEELNQNKGFCNTGDIQSILKNEFNINMSRSGLSRRLHQLGYRWGRSRPVGGMTHAARIARGVTYMKELAIAIEEEKSENSVLVFTDESYVNVGHKIQYTWFSIYSPQQNEVGVSDSKREREILLQAITKFGLLGGGEVNNPDLSSTLPPGQESAQHFFIGGYIGEDYHKNMDDDFFINWTKNRFIPAFKSKFPNKKCILILDNANYHHAPGPDYMKLGGTKKELIEKLKKLEVKSIKVEREGKQIEFKQSTWNGRGGKLSPTVKELNESLRVELPKHKEFQTTEIQKLFDRERWQLIYTPPYTPEVQPIEKVWAYVKHIIASQFTPSRTKVSLHVDVIMAFYGNPHDNYPGITEEFCQSVIDHSLKWCNQFINDHIFPGGNLSSLAQWIEEHPEEEGVEDANEDIIEGAIEEEVREGYDVFEFQDDES
jgi:transposase